jgi:hypothetical protein
VRKTKQKNRSTFENAANEDRKYCSTQFFSSLLVANAVARANLSHFVQDLEDEVHYGKLFPGPEKREQGA